MNLDEAIQKHAEWKMKFRVAITKKEKMDAAAIQGDKNCQLGQWLHGEGHVRYGQSPTFKDLIVKHASFHRAAGKVASTINAGQYDVAAGMIDGGTEYTQASVAVGVAIMQLKKEIS
jgi:methyl-accepting chemotaxis protein